MVLGAWIRIALSFALLLPGAVPAAESVGNPPP